MTRLMRTIVQDGILRHSGVPHRNGVFYFLHHGNTFFSLIEEWNLMSYNPSLYSQQFLHLDTRNDLRFGDITAPSLRKVVDFSLEARSNFTAVESGGSAVVSCHCPSIGKWPSRRADFSSSHSGGRESRVFPLVSVSLSCRVVPIIFMLRL